MCYAAVRAQAYLRSHDMGTARGHFRAVPTLFVWNGLSGTTTDALCACGHQFASVRVSSRSRPSVFDAARRAFRSGTRGLYALGVDSEEMSHGVRDSRWFLDHDVVPRARNEHEF